MSKKRLQHVLAGQEMVESSGSDSETDVSTGTLASRVGDLDPNWIHIGKNRIN